MARAGVLKVGAAAGLRGMPGTRAHVRRRAELNIVIVRRMRRVLPT